MKKLFLPAVGLIIIILFLISGEAFYKSQEAKERGIQIEKEIEENNRAIDSLLSVQAERKRIKDSIRWSRNRRIQTPMPIWRGDSIIWSSEGGYIPLDLND